MMRVSVFDKRFPILMTVVACAALSACGGGSGGSSSDTAAASASQSTDTAATAAAPATQEPVSADQAAAANPDQGFATTAAAAAATSVPASTDAAAAVAPAAPTSADAAAATVPATAPVADAAAATAPAADGTPTPTADGIAKAASVIAVEGTTPINPIQASDIRLQVDAAQTFSSYRWNWGVECDGQVQGAINVPETGLSGSFLSGFGSQRFGKVADPANPAKKVLMFRANQDDARASGAPRCELTFSPSFNGKLPVNQEFWYAFGVRLDKWTPGKDEQILMQWHWGNGTIPLGPFLALSLSNGVLKFDTKTSAISPPSIASSKTTVLYQNTSLPVDKWTYFVIKAKISYDSGQAPYIKIWRDGAQVVNYNGPVGYNYPAVQPYAKIGHYQWVQSYNTWTTPTKTVLYRAPSLISDTLHRYNEADIRSFVVSH
jgi:hypothetical protein